MDITLVTAYYDLHKRENRPGTKTAQEYFEYASKWLLAKEQQYPVIVFCDPENVTGIKNAAKCPPERLTVIGTPLEEISPWYPQLECINRALAENSNTDRNPDKDTAWYTLLGWTKLRFLQRAMLSIPANSAFCWIDFAINHVARIPADWKLNPSTFSKECMHCLSINPCIRAPDVPLTYFQRRKWKIGGGFWLFPHSGVLQEVVSMFHSTITYLLQDLRLAPLEDEVLGYMAGQRPQLFKMHYGDYADILNLDYPRHSYRLIVRGLDACLRTGPDMFLVAFDMLSALLRNPEYAEIVRRELLPAFTARIRTFFGYLV